MEFLDICFDLETCSRSANAAVVSIAATVFDRYGEKPFPEIRHATFQKSVDLRWCLIDGFDFDPQTCKWWSEQSSEAKGSLVDGEPEPLESAVLMFFAWINEQKCMNKIDGNNVRLWCQGTDFDAAILRTICRKYDIKMPFSYYDFRDARTFVKEGLQGYSDRKSVV